VLPELFPIRREQRFGETNDLLNECFRFRSERQFDSLIGPKQIGHYRKPTSLHSFEKQRRTAAIDYAPVNLSKFQAGIDFGFNRYEIVFTAEDVEEGTKVRMH